MPSVDNNVAKILRSIPAIDENGLRVLAMIVGVVRQVAPSPVAEPAVESVELPETPPVASESPVALPETEPAVESQAVAPSSPTYRLVLNVPEIGLKGFAD